MACFRALGCAKIKGCAKYQNYVIIGYHRYSPKENRFGPFRIKIVKDFMIMIVLVRIKSFLKQKHNPCLSIILEICKKIGFTGKK